MTGVQTCALPIWYLVGAAGYLFALGSAELTFGAGGFKYADETLDDGSTVVGAANELFTLSFTIDGTTATPLDPGHGGGIDLHLLNGRGWVDVSFLASRGATLTSSSVLDASAEFTLSGAGAAGVELTTVELVSGTTFRFHFVGLFTTGQVTMNFVAGA